MPLPIQHTVIHPQHVPLYTSEFNLDRSLAWGFVGGKLTCWRLTAASASIILACDWLTVFMVRQRHDINTCHNNVQHSTGMHNFICSYFCLSFECIVNIVCVDLFRGCDRREQHPSVRPYETCSRKTSGAA